MSTLILIALIVWTVLVSVGTGVVYLAFGLAPGGLDSLDWADKWVPLIVGMALLVVPWAIYLWMGGAR